MSWRRLMHAAAVSAALAVGLEVADVACAAPESFVVDPPTQIISSTSANPIDLAYLPGKSGRGWQIYDLNIMGIWLVQTHENEFNEVIDRRGIDGLIRMLTEKNRQLAVGKSS
ncbi:toluene tolerance family protein [Burkholderiales bacterium GJ-E10]|nr:toluene tolerance family protein [Burkholderiales bacterium GJ-E10]